MNIRNAKILNPSKSGIKVQEGSIVIQTNTGHMWGKGNVCSDIVLFPQKLTEASVEVSLNLFPQFGGEQAGIVLFVDSDNYVKFVREMIDGKQVVALVKEFAGEPTLELKTPFESSFTNLKLNIRTDSTTIYWKSNTENEFKEANFPNWFNHDLEFQIGLLVSGNNPNNEATFYSLSINGQLQ